MSQRNLGEDGNQILTRFRAVAKSYTALFQAQRDHIHQLLGSTQNYSSGIFRESLLRNFLTTVLPRSISVDSGFVYGFEQIDNSRQIDILVWDSGRHAAVYQSQEFVIVPPEAVIAAISVKTTLNKADLVDSLENLLSLTPLELEYRVRLDPNSNTPMFRSITKIVVSYEGPSNLDTALDTIGEFFQERFASNQKVAAEMIDAFQNWNPPHPAQEQIQKVERVIPKLIAVIDSDNASMIQGWGPPEDVLGTNTYGPGLRRLPYMYVQKNKLTTPLEKVVYHVLESVYLALGTLGSSIVSAWGEFNPSTESRLGDAWEIDEERGIQLLDPDRLAS